MMVVGPRLDTPVGTGAGNAHVRRVIVQLDWGWLHHQPDSALSHWYQRRFAQGGKRVRKIGIVALARKLLVALWRYLEFGVIPDGAKLKPMEVRGPTQRLSANELVRAPVKSYWVLFEPQCRRGARFQASRISLWCPGHCRRHG